MHLSWADSSVEKILFWRVCCKIRARSFPKFVFGKVWKGPKKICLFVKNWGGTFELLTLVACFTPSLTRDMHKNQGTVTRETRRQSSPMGRWDIEPQIHPRTPQKAGLESYLEVSLAREMGYISVCVFYKVLPDKFPKVIRYSWTTGRAGGSKDQLSPSRAFKEKLYQLTLC